MSSMKEMKSITKWKTQSALKHFHMDELQMALSRNEFAREVEPDVKRLLNKGHGLHLWRIEGDAVSGVARLLWGAFQKDAAYLVLQMPALAPVASSKSAATSNGKQLQNKPVMRPAANILTAANDHQYDTTSVKLLKSVQCHLWLGSRCTYDQLIAGMLKLVQMEILLRNLAEQLQHQLDTWNIEQYREAEDHESSLFLSYFQGGIRYIENWNSPALLTLVGPGMSVGAQLYRVYGEAHPRCSELVPLTWRAMNPHLCCLYHVGNCVFVWRGRLASNALLQKAMEFAKQLGETKGGHFMIECVLEGREQAIPDLMKELWCSVPSMHLLKSNEMEVTNNVNGDLVTYHPLPAYDFLMTEPVQLYQCLEENEKLIFIEMSAPTTDCLLNGSIMLLDTGSRGIWAWCGANALPEHKRLALNHAMCYLEKLTQLDPLTPLMRINQGHEPCLFMDFLANNLSSPLSLSQSFASTKSYLPWRHEYERVKKPFTLKLWNVTDVELIPMETTAVPRFYGGDTYIVQVFGPERLTFQFVWQGLQSEPTERSLAIQQALQWDTQYGCCVSLVRVVQDSEPDDFLSLFDGHLLTLENGRYSWDRGLSQINSFPEDAFFQVVGLHPPNTKAMQVSASLNCFRSDSVFLLFGKMDTFVWCGKCTTGDQREAGKVIAESLRGQGYQIVPEGSELPEFWATFTEKLQQSSTMSQASSATPTDMTMMASAGAFMPLTTTGASKDATSMAIPARLFHAQRTATQLWMEEIVDFTQEHLVPGPVMLLDCWNKIYTWTSPMEVGLGDRDVPLQIAKMYLKIAQNSTRDINIPLYCLHAGAEPEQFTRRFPRWKSSTFAYPSETALKMEHYPDLFPNSTTKDNVLRSVSMNSLNSARNPNAIPPSSYQIYSLEQLQISLPPGVEANKKELYLNEEDFHHAFNMRLEDFQKLPQWRRDALKKSAGLF